MSCGVGSARTTATRIESRIVYLGLKRVAEICSWRYPPEVGEQARNPISTPSVGDSECVRSARHGFQTWISADDYGCIDRLAASKRIGSRPLKTGDGLRGPAISGSVGARMKCHSAPLIESAVVACHTTHSAMWPSRRSHSCGRIEPPRSVSAVGAGNRRANGKPGLPRTP